MIFASSTDAGGSNAVDNTGFLAKMCLVVAVVYAVIFGFWVLTILIRALRVIWKDEQ